MKRFLLIAYLYLIVDYQSGAITNNQDSTVTFFPDNRLFPSLFLDPLECQMHGGTCFLFRKGSDVSLYSPVNLGFTKPVFAKKGESISWELKFGAATFAQFDLIRRDDGIYLAGLLNNDYKVSGDFTVQKNNHTLQFRIFHVSSHKGDDYMLRHNDTVPNDKSVNYEQADLTYLKANGSNYWYVGIGEIYTIYAFRERLSFHGGGLYNFGPSNPVNLFTSVNVKLFAENDFIPDIRTALGINFNRRSEPLVRIWLEYYSGQLPYSTLDYGRVNWIGLAMKISLL